MLSVTFDRKWARLIWLLVLGIFVADLSLPLKIDIVFSYLLAHFLAILFREKSDVLLLAVVTTTLTVIGTVVRAQDVALSEMLLQRLPAIVSFWAAALFVVRFITLRDMEGQQEEKFKALFHFATNGILLTDKKGFIVMANPALEALFGYAEGELLGKAVEVLIPARIGKAHSASRERFHQNPHPRSMGIGLDLNGVKKDGAEFPVEVSLSPFRSSGGDFVVAFVIDNTFRKNHENSILQQKQELAALTEALKNLNEDLENKVSERTAELERAKDELAAALDQERELGELKSRFVSMASHEFRTPLTSMLSSAGLATQYAERQDFENVKKHTERIKNAVKGLNAILTEFLSLGRLEDGRLAVNPEEVNLNVCVAEVYDGLKTLFKPGQTFTHTHIGPETAQLDCNLIKNILINLISNAIKYSPEHSPITVDTFIQHGVVKLCVNDKGMGIPDADKKYLFGRFFRASNAANTTQGTGLGLYIVQRYADIMGGTVGFESSLDQGSCFWVEFPVLTPI